MEQFTQWDVVVTLATLFGFIALLLKPAINLVQSLTRLAYTVNEMEKRMTKFEVDNTSEHKEFKEKFEAHDNLINKHELILCGQNAQNGG